MLSKTYALIILLNFALSFNVNASTSCSTLFAQDKVYAPQMKLNQNAQSELPSKSIVRVITEDKQARKDAFKVIPKIKNYFAALNQRMLERKYVLDLAEVALIAEEHLLLMGPPGNAKSQISDLVLGHVKDESGKSSYFRLQMTPETTMSETHGPIDYKKLNDEGRQERIYDQGALKSKNVFFDEIFDARTNAIRNILGLLAERQHAQGPNIVKGDIQTAFGATNRYLSEVYEKAGDDGPKAVVDRFALVSFIPATFESTDSSVALITRKKSALQPLPELTFNELDLLRNLNSQVEINVAVAKALTLLSYRMKAETEALELSAVKAYKEKIKKGEEASIPYRATKFHSPRTIGKAANILRAYVVRDWIATDGRRKLEANMEDLAKLESFFTLNGPTDEFVMSELARTSNPHERAQLMTILQEREIFKRNYTKIVEEMNAVAVKYALQDLSSFVFSARSPQEKTNAIQTIISLMARVQSEIRLNIKQSELDGSDIGRDYVLSYLESMLKFFESANDNQNNHTAVNNEITRQKQAIIVTQNAENLASEKLKQTIIDSQRAEVLAKLEQKKAKVREAARLKKEANLAREAVEKSKLELKEKFQNSKKFKLISRKVPYEPKKFDLFAGSPNGEYAIHYQTKQDVLHLTQFLATNGKVTSKTTVLNEVLGADLVTDPSHIFATDQNTIFFVSNRGRTVHKYDIDQNFIETISIAEQSVATTVNRRTGEIISIDAKNSTLRIIRPDGESRTIELTFAANANTHELDAALQSDVKSFEISADGKHGVLIDYQTTLFYDINFETQTVSSLTSGKKRPSRENVGVLDSSVASVFGIIATVVKMNNGGTPEIVDVNIGNVNRDAYYGSIFLEKANLMLTASHDNGWGINLVDTTSGEKILSNAFGIGNLHTGKMSRLSDSLFMISAYDKNERSWTIKYVKFEK